MTSEQQTEDNGGIDTGADRRRSPGHDWEGYADDGEYAMVWGVTRVSETTVAVEYYAVEAARRERMGSPSVGDGRETFDVSADKSTKEWVRECANTDPQLAIERVRDHFDK